MALPESNGNAMAGSEMMQVIDYEGTFNSKLSPYLSASGFDKGTDYSVVAIMGAQSSGKSTLLNVLFRTRFPTMEAERGRSQTTQGIWMAKAAERDIVVMDVEGTDSRERGEESASYERQIALFSLAMCRVLIINVWEHDLGRYQASNLALLKLVFEVNLELFSASDSSKKLLMFVIRDHIESTTPLERLRTMIRSDISTIWASLQKPDQFRHSDSADFFDVDIVSLPHMRLMQAEFTAKAEALRNRFHDPKDPAFVFNGPKQDIPLDGFSSYAASIWETIKSNRDLDLPTQKEMVAVFRCDEIKGQVYEEAEKLIAPLHGRVSSGAVVQGLGAAFQEISDTAMDNYDKVAQRYFPAVCARKRKELTEKLLEAMGRVYGQQLANQRDQCMAAFTRDMAYLLRSGATAEEFVAKAKAMIADAEAVMAFVADDALLQGVDWNHLKLKQELHAMLHKSFLTKLFEERKGQVGATINNELQQIFDNPTADMWAKIRALRASVLLSTTSSLKAILSDFNASVEQTGQWEDDLHCHATTLIFNKIREAPGLLLVRMRKRFDELFRYDEDKLPRTWKANDDIKKIYFVARDAGLELIGLFEINRLDMDDNNDSPGVAESLVILTQEKCADLRARFCADVDAAYLEAKMAQENSLGRSHIPIWVMVALAIFAFDEIMMVLKNPLLMIIAVPVALIAWGLYYTGNLGLALRLSQTISATVMGAVQTALSPPPATPVKAPPTDKSKRESVELSSFKREGSRTSSD
eukprot:gnl/Hemi2/16028_TR5312_c0_g1_i1.p1 gnl/Hemi2/16028_TR5312_c0_g1~~gnl/Hemi2/16028_TR5312_c0_g1_i1.p1  ORF type:complete len:755 (+),score=269.77 gnl/Hemi2/16028_TR5312_c0_g1_i1:101-2365(+)